VEYLAPCIHTYPRNSTSGLVWENDEEEKENEVEKEEQEEWEGAVKAGFIFTLDDIMKSLELFLQLM
jgi:hypothetical protein